MSSSLGCPGAWCGSIPSNSHSIRPLDSVTFMSGFQTAHLRTRQPRIDRVYASHGRETEQVDAVGDVQVDGVNRDYCDDFICTSSPLVEQTVKALARDLLRQRTWTSSLFSPSVEYKDGLRSFRGVEKYRRLNYAADCLKNSAVDVLKLRMLDRGTAEALWTLSGSVGVIPISIPFTSTFKLDLITGRVLEHSDRWDLSTSTVQARIAFLTSRALWSMRQAMQDATGDGHAVLDKLSIDEPEQQTFYRDHTDPTRFFHQEDNTLQDAIWLAAVLGVFYILVNAWRQLADLH